VDIPDFSRIFNFGNRGIRVKRTF